MNALTGKEDFLRADEYLIPAIADDPLLRTSTLHYPTFGVSAHQPPELQSDDWSDDEDVAASTETPSDLSQALRKIRALENALHKTQQDLADYRGFVGDRLNLAGLADALAEPSTSTSTHVAAPLRDDDSHYFQSYGENGACSVGQFGGVVLTSRQIFTP